MTVFQLLLIIIVALATVLVLRRLSGDRSLAIKRLLAALFAAVALIAIVFPEALTRVANLLGIGRGTDLLLYVAIIGAMLFVWATIRSRARQDAKVTELARAVALMEARLTEGRSDRGNS
ncbi:MULTISPECIES: DUF2304 domain-containing protein [unclassified Leucobacter]|uniref:DUF2304 domain-containing protein n=1 Tax=unclassified Leucobacter TaxID=2621730 RepID=UPI00165E062E|nr:MULTISPECIES: DUF2304 domain-containing protein [unclassified Leucobacter]MBC9927529.1 DUF2304 domain-containing protein [Leucobacter sp. cx-169]